MMIEVKSEQKIKNLKLHNEAIAYDIKVDLDLKDLSMSRYQYISLTRHLTHSST